MCIYIYLYIHVHVCVLYKMWFPWSNKPIPRAFVTSCAHLTSSFEAERDGLDLKREANGLKAPAWLLPLASWWRHGGVMTWAGISRGDRTWFPKMLAAMDKILESLSWQSSTIHRESELLQKAKPWFFGTPQNLSKCERDFLDQIQRRQ